MRNQVVVSLGDLGNLDLSTLQQFSPDVDLPASREEIGSSAESNKTLPKSASSR